MGNELSLHKQNDRYNCALSLSKIIQDKHITEVVNKLLITQLNAVCTLTTTVMEEFNLIIEDMKKQSILVGKAIIFASEKHKFQRRKSDDSAYINHPLRVMQILVDYELANAGTLCAAVLHDTVEDTDATIEEIKENFGEEIAGYVAEVTDDKSLPKLEIKKRQIENAKHKSLGGTVVKLADKLDNLRSFNQGYPKNWSEDMVQGYKRWCKEVIINLPNHEDSGFKDNIKKLKDECLTLCDNDFDLEKYYDLIRI